MIFISTVPELQKYKMDWLSLRKNTNDHILTEEELNRFFRVHEFIHIEEIRQGTDYYYRSFLGYTNSVIHEWVEFLN